MADLLALPPVVWVSLAGLVCVLAVPVVAAELADRWLWRSRD